MSDIHNIDELLKNSFSSFEAPPPPDAWSAIQQGLPASGTSASGQAAGKAATVVKSAGVITKAVAVFAAAAVVTGSYFAYTYFNHTADDSKKEIQAPVISQPAPDPQPKVAEEAMVMSDQSVSTKPSIKANNQSTVHNGQSKPAVQASKEPQSPVVNAEAEQAKTLIQQNNTDQKPAQQNLEQKGMQVKPAAQPGQVLPKPKHHFNEEKKSESRSADEAQADRPIIPNTFTPDNDGHNDRFVILIENETLYDLKIFDKEGRQVYESNSREKTWDGKNDDAGEACEAGTYIYRFRYQYKGSKETMTINGKINLIR